MKSEPKNGNFIKKPSGPIDEELPLNRPDRRSQSEADYDYFSKLAEEAHLAGDDGETPHHQVNGDVPAGESGFSTHPDGRLDETPSPRAGENPTHLADLPEEPLTVSDIWAAALLPQTRAFDEILKDPNASRGRAYAWMAIAGAATYGFSMVIQILFGFLAFRWPTASGTSPAHLTLGIETSVGLILAGLPVSAAAAVIGLMVLASLYQFIARILGGRGTFPWMVYALASFLAPLSITTGIIAAIPYVNVLLIPIFLYSTALTLTAVRTVNHLNWWKASLVVILIPGLTGAGLLALAAAALRYFLPPSAAAALIGLYHTILGQIQTLIP